MNINKDNRVLAGELDIMVVTPGRLQEYVDRGLVSLRQVQVRTTHL